MTLAITNPLFIWLLPVALLPLVFHLYYRLRRKPVKFPSFMFFLMIDRRFSARRRIREYLLLLARMLFIALLLLALSGIVATGTKSEGTRHSMAIVIDNSSSMGMEGFSGGRSNFELAVETAGKIIASMGGGDRAALILTVEDPAASLPAECTGDKNLLKASLDNFALTEAQGNIPAALNRALATLEKTHADRFEIHVLSDMQQHEWQASAPIALDSLSTNFDLSVHRMPVKALERGNAAIASMRFLEPRFIVNRASVLEITLVNNSLHDAQFQLDIRDSSGSARSETIALQSGGESVVHHTIVPKLNGLHWAAAQIEGDSFAGDNKAFVAFNCSGVKKVALCGDVKDFGVLPLAIAPAPDGALSGMINLFCSPAYIRTILQEDKPLFIALTWQSISALDEQSVAALKAFVSGGGSILVLPSSVSPESTENVPQWLGARPGRPLATQQPGQPKAPLKMMATGKSQPFWDGLRDSAGNVVLQNLLMFNGHALDAGNAFTPLIAMENGETVIASRPEGKGRIFVSGIDFSPISTNLPLKPGFVPMAHKMALSGTVQEALPAKLQAGEKYSSEDSSVPFDVRSLAGAPLNCSGTAQITFPAAGVYSISKTGDSASVQVCAVSAANREGEMLYVPGETLPMLQGVNHSVCEFRNPEAFMEQFSLLRAGRNYFKTLLALALAVILVETLIGNPGKAKFKQGSQSGSRGGAGGSSFSPCLVPTLATVRWHYELSPLSSTLCILAAIVVIFICWRNLRQRLARPAIPAVMLPKIIVAALLFMAFFDPVWVSEKPAVVRNKLLVVTDDSSSMEVACRDGISRASRTKSLRKKLVSAMPRTITTEQLFFDTALRDSQSPQTTHEGTETIRGTDIGTLFANLAKRGDADKLCAVVVMTDGGDEAVEIPDFPSAPLALLGIGPEETEYDDLAIESLRFPADAEKSVNFDVSADISANLAAGLPQAGFPVSLSLERMEGGEWKQLEQKKHVMMGKLSRVSFSLKEEEPGTASYRLSIATMPHELTLLNNSREFKVNIQKESLNVMYFTNRLGLNFRAIRAELARDPGVSLTAVIRTLGDSFIIQGDRIPGDDSLASGLPENQDQLRRYDIIILDSFPSEYLDNSRSEALKSFVENGGALIFLGGEHSFSEGGYAASALDILFPWKLDTRPQGLKRGAFVVDIPTRAFGHPVVAGMRQLVAQAKSPFVESLNITGPAKPAAETLVEAEYMGWKTPLVSIMPYGKGQVLGIATNTLWRWSTQESSLREAHSLFWRQAVRNITRKEQATGTFSAKWDKPSYRPGEEAEAVIRPFSPDTSPVAQDMRFHASLLHGVDTVKIPVSRVHDSPGTHLVKLRFSQRGEYSFTLTGYSRDGSMEVYEKNFPVSPLLSEGSNIGVDKAYLSALATKAGGKFYNESQFEQLKTDILDSVSADKITVETSIVYNKPWFFFVVLLLLVAEWVARRRASLV